MSIPVAHHVVVVSFAVAAAAAMSLSFAACASELGSPSAALRDGDAGNDAPISTAQQCARTEDCRNHNELCLLTAGQAVRSCQLPPMGGACDVDADGAVGDTSACYPGARCQPVPRDLSMRGGMCSFQGPQAPAFAVDDDAPKISLSEPNALRSYDSTNPITLRWTRPSLPADAITVAVILRSVPQREGQTNRLRNPQDLVWIWASTDPGNASPGQVSLGAGHSSLAADGSLGARYATERLANGRYWWFVYALRAGRVVAASDVVGFRVGPDFVSVPCASVETCTAALPGEVADTVACVGGRCRRRCASDVDCPGQGARCEFAERVTASNGENVPRGAFCSVILPRS